MKQEIKDRIVERSVAGIIVGLILMVVAACFGVWYNPTHRG